jgi:hypothetical protein
MLVISRLEWLIVHSFGLLLCDHLSSSWMISALSVVFCSRYMVLPWEL